MKIKNLYIFYSICIFSSLLTEGQCIGDGVFDLDFDQLTIQKIKNIPQDKFQCHHIKLINVKSDKKFLNYKEEYRASICNKLLKSIAEGSVREISYSYTEGSHYQFLSCFHTFFEIIKNRREEFFIKKVIFNGEEYFSLKSRFYLDKTGILYHGLSKFHEWNRVFPYDSSFIFIRIPDIEVIDISDCERKSFWVEYYDHGIGDYDNDAVNRDIKVFFEKPQIEINRFSIESDNSKSELVRLFDSSKKSINFYFYEVRHDFHIDFIKNIMRNFEYNLNAYFVLYFHSHASESVKNNWRCIHEDRKRIIGLLNCTSSRPFLLCTRKDW